MLGRLFYDTGNIGEKTMQRIKTMAQELGREGFEYAFVMDQIKEERMRGITIGLAHKKLLVDGISFTFADAPGHKDFVKNMLVGASESDATILIVAADEGVQSQTKQHLYLSKMLGVPNVIVVVNKMDLADYSQQRFKEVHKQVTELINKVGYHVDEVPVIPCSALQGDNVVKKSQKMSWYDGPSFLKLIKNLPSRKVPSDLPLRLPVQDVWKVNGKQMVVGRLETGALETGQEVLAMPGQKKFTVKQMLKQDAPVKKALPGDNLLIELDGESKDGVERGNILGEPGKKPSISDEFQAQVMILKSSKPVTQGHECVFGMLTEEVPCKIQKLLRLVDTVTGEMTPNPKQVKEGESAVLQVKTDKPVYVEAQEKIPHLSGFRLIENDKNMGMGICIDVEASK
jgi:elongation factor 1-alpha